MALPKGSGYKVRCSRKHPSGRAVRGKLSGKIKLFPVAGSMTLNSAMGKAMSDARHKGVRCCVIAPRGGKRRKQSAWGERHGRRCYGDAE